MSTQVGDDDPFDIGDLWSTDEEGPTDGPCPTPLGPLDSKSMGDLGLERHDVPEKGQRPPLPLFRLDVAYIVDYIRHYCGLLSKSS